MTPLKHSELFSVLQKNLGYKFEQETVTGNVLRKEVFGLSTETPLYTIRAYFGFGAAPYLSVNLRMKTGGQVQLRTTAQDNAVEAFEALVVTMYQTGSFVS